MQKAADYGVTLVVAVIGGLLVLGFVLSHIPNITKFIP
jgi:hypothetical protein